MRDEGPRVIAPLKGIFGDQPSCGPLQDSGTRVQTVCSPSRLWIKKKKKKTRRQRRSDIVLKLVSFSYLYLGRVWKKMPSIIFQNINHLLS